MNPIQAFNVNETEMRQIQDLSSEEFKVYMECVDTLAVCLIEHQDNVSEGIEEEDEGIEAYMDSIAAITNRLQIHPNKIQSDINSLADVKRKKTLLH